MTVKAALSGDEIDLQYLATLLASGETRVVNEDGDYYLTSTHIDNHPTGATYHEAAQRLLPIINGFGRSSNAGFRAVTLAGRYREEHRLIAVVLAAVEARSHIHAVATVTDGSGVVVSPSQPLGPGHVSLALRNADVAEVLGYMGQDDPPGWFELYKVHEIIKVHVPRKDFRRLGGTSPGQHKAFTASANFREISGSAARHARRPGSPPGRTMSLDEGRQFICRLVAAWVDPQLSESPSTTEVAG